MTIPVQTRLTPAEFDRIAALPENADRLLEFIDGEMVEKPMPAGRKSSTTNSRLTALVGAYVFANRLGEITDAQGGYQVGDDRLIPDSAFIHRERLPAEEVTGYTSIAPDLAIEILSTTDRPGMVARKVNAYLRHGVTLWLVDPFEQSVTVYFPDRSAVTYHATDTLVGDPVLPGFTLDLALMFAAG